MQHDLSAITTTEELVAVAIIWQCEDYFTGCSSFRMSQPLADQTIVRTEAASERRQHNLRCRSELIAIINKKETDNNTKLQRKVFAMMS